MNPKLFDAAVIACNKVAKETFCLTLKSDLIAKHARAGQFVNVSVPREADILWRRPFSIHRVDPQKSTFDLLFSVVGKGTHILSQLAPPMTLDVLGPLGNHFEYPNDKNRLLIVAGGLGVAPFFKVLQEVAHRDLTIDFVYGVSSADYFCFLSEITSYCNLILATDDGSKGVKGTVINALETLSHIQKDDTRVLVCGPNPMLRAVQTYCQQHQLDAFVSVENTMACGFGACMGCPVPMKNPPNEGKQYYLACKDGPVFDMSEIIVDE
ncbi:hypothetical protein GF406_02385 [candidate division KSB1 bacterium]|jgi:dihydroorotate dehydrogenase electron transfer subunit|nr:hypothetical protein [candidate division KSB1 bacterium]